jgi:hypothetical protein
MKEEYKYSLAFRIVATSFVLIIFIAGMWWLHINIKYSTYSEPSDDIGFGTVIWILILYYLYKIRIKPYI